MAKIVLLGIKMDGESIYWRDGSALSLAEILAMIGGEDKNEEE